MSRSLATATLAAAMGLAAAGAAFAADMSSDPKAMTMQRMTQNHLEKCFGVAAKGRNDCAQGAHSCAGQATMDRDAASFILLPMGDCSKLAGGKTSAG